MELKQEGLIARWLDFWHEDRHNRPNNLCALFWNALLPLLFLIFKALFLLFSVLVVAVSTIKEFHIAIWIWLVVAIITAIISLMTVTAELAKRGYLPSMPSLPISNDIKEVGSVAKLWVKSVKGKFCPIITWSNKS